MTSSALVLSPFVSAAMGYSTIASSAVASSSLASQANLRVSARLSLQRSLDGPGFLTGKACPSSTSILMEAFPSLL